jgi:putative sugar O-methyltransferase
MNYVALMKDMLADAQKAPAIFSPGPYWKPHAELMIGLIERHGIEKFRAIPDKALIAFATGNQFKPPASRALQLNEAMRRLPVVRRFADAIARNVDIGFGRARSEANYKLHVVFALLQEIAPDLAELQESGVGSPPKFNIYGRSFSEMFLLKLLEIALLRQYVDFDKIGSVIEIGGSYGLFGEILRKRYPAIRYTLVDLAPVAGFAQFYLSNVFPGQVSGYCEPADAPIRIRCAHQMPEMSGPFDLFVNVASFQEMSAEQVAMYADFARGNSAAAYLNNTRVSGSNGLSTDDYAALLLPMQRAASWNSTLHEGYQPVLLRMSGRP